MLIGYCSVLKDHSKDPTYISDGKPQEQLLKQLVSHVTYETFRAIPITWRECRLQLPSDRLARSSLKTLGRCQCGLKVLETQAAILC